MFPLQFEAHPFHEDDGLAGEPASVAYLYRQFSMGSVRIVARCELHGWVDKRDNPQFFTSYALNEWDSSMSNGVNWRQKIDTTRGAVLATEIQNNNCKVAKWTAQSLLAGVPLMKLGYVSRVTPTESNEHQILATQFQRPKELAQQLGMQIPNIWGIVKMFCETLLQSPDGKYLIWKDPNKPSIRLYSVPVTAFEEYEEEGEDGDEEGEGEAEEGEGAAAETA